MSAQAGELPIEAYIDESGTGDRDLVHCLAGYVIKPNHGVEMARRWQFILDRYNLAFFHMADCAAFQHCEPYKNLGKIKCIALATELIKLIKKHCSHGFAVCFSPSYYAVYQERGLSSLERYSFSVKVIFDQIRVFVGDVEGGRSINYTFEAGHRHQQKAQKILGLLVSQDVERGSIFEYSFKRKQDSILLQAADILAWHCNT